MKAIRFRLLTGSAGAAVFEASSGEEFVEKLADAQKALGCQHLMMRSAQLFIWHRGSWWNLTRDLSRFTAWMLEVTAADIQDLRRFAAYPYEHPAWLFLAAEQMRRLLEAASASG